jgi:hypothetical protein
VRLAVEGCGPRVVEIDDPEGDAPVAVMVRAREIEDRHVTGITIDGRGGVRRPLLGRVVDDGPRHAPCPVLPA